MRVAFGDGRDNSCACVGVVRNVSKVTVVFVVGVFLSFLVVVVAVTLDSL